MEWKQYWENLLKEHKLIDVCQGLREIDKDLKNDEFYTENLCKNIYDSYDDIKKKLCDVKELVENKLDKIKDVHLSTGRIKTIDSILVKVITKRSQYTLEINSKYSDMNVDTVKDVLTDLVGLKFIINYRGRWQDIHKQVLKIFPMLNDQEYNKQLIPHRMGESFIAELPVAYYAENDDITQYKKAGIETKLHKSGYRSVHYIISCENTYIELQVRTIYDEAWSDCDHNYVYKQEANPNNVALKRLSMILNKLTNSANDIGDMMHEIFNGKSFDEVKSNSWLVDSKYKETIERITNSIEKAKDDLKNFNNDLMVK